MKVKKIFEKELSKTKNFNYKIRISLYSCLLMNGNGLLASCLLSLLSKNTNLELAIHFKLVKDTNSNRLNGLLIEKTLLVTLYDNLLTFRDTLIKFELQEDLLNVITSKDYNDDLGNLSE